MWLNGAWRLSADTALNSSGSRLNASPEKRERLPKERACNEIKEGLRLISHPHKQRPSATAGGLNLGIFHHKNLWPSDHI
jgi:hypothetical protein